MGNRQPNYNGKIGKQSECPICGLQFKSSDTYGSVGSTTNFALSDLFLIGERTY